MNFKDKINLKHIIDNNSIKTVTDIFNAIDKKIISLFECSSDDFMLLNTKFKNYYKQAKSLSQNATEILSDITDKSVQKYFEDLKYYQGNFSDLLTSFSNHVENLIAIFIKLEEHLDALFIPYSNYKQNLLSLKLLFTNLRLNENIINELANFENFTSEIDNCITEIKKIFKETENNYKVFKSSILANKILSQELKQKNVDTLKKIIEKINISIGLFTQKYQEAVDRMPFLKDRSDNYSLSIEKIITNLQYHDIIRQKVEHIQRTHQDIIKELQQYSKSDKVQIHNQAKTLLKIRDIAGLQVAQLLHANKQYQSAIEVITSTFNEIGDDILSIWEMCRQVYGKHSSTYVSAFDEISTNLNKATNSTNEFIYLTQTLKTNITSLNNLYETFYSKFTEIKGMTLKLEEVYKTFYTEVLSKAEGENEIQFQINSLFDDIDHFTVQIVLTSSELHNLNNLLLRETDEFYREYNSSVSFNDFTINITDLINMLNEKNNKIENLLKVNADISSYIYSEIKESVKNVKYYVLFEKVSEEIISELNDINLKVNYTADFAEDKEKTLTNLKKVYTMDSEHIIHDHIAKKSDNNIDVNLTKKTISKIEINRQENDENLELF